MEGLRRSEERAELPEISATKGGEAAPATRMMSEAEAEAFLDSKNKGVSIVPLTEDGKVRKIVMGHSGVQPRDKEGVEVQDGYTVYVHILGILKNTQKVFMEQTQERIEFVIGQNEVPRALELGLKTMKVGERALIESSFEYAFQEGRYPEGISPETVSADEVIIYDVTLVSVDVEKDLLGLEPEQLFEFANSKKTEGNNLIKTAVRSALSQYEKGLRAVNLIPMHSLEEYKLDASNVTQLKVSLLNNCSLCCIKLEMIEEAESYLDRALGVDKTNTKARFRKAQCLKARKDWDASLTVLREALSDCAEGDAQTRKALQAEISAVQKLKKEEFEEEKKKYAGFFNKTNGLLYEDRIAESEAKAGSRWNVCTRVMQYLQSWVPNFVKNVFVPEKPKLE